MELMQQAIENLKNDPVLFVRKTLEVETIEPWQEEVLQTIITNDRISIRSGHGVGKTTLLAWIILWWMLFREDAKVACTAPTSHQLKDVLWSELAKWKERLPEYFKRYIVLNTDRLGLEGTPNFAAARTARKDNPDAFQGFHAKNMLFIADEASGIDEPIFIAGEGAMSTAGAKTILTGNPTRSNGYFFDSFHKDRNKWKTFVIPCSSSSRVDPLYVESMKEKYGEESNIYRVRVLGEFPLVDDDVLIPLDLLESSVGREIDQTGRMIWGLDVARFGSDRSALAKRFGNYQLEPVKWWASKDLMQLVGLIKMEYDKTPEKQKPVRIMVDVIGMGAGVLDRLVELGMPAQGINVAEAPATSNNFFKKKDELWFTYKDWLEKRDCVLQRDDDLIGESSIIKYKIDSNGKMRIESKDELKKRGHRSPDIAEAFVLTFATFEDRPVPKPTWQKKLDYDLNYIV